MICAVVLLRDAMRKRDASRRPVSVCLSVCLSVHLSITLMYCVETAKDGIKLFLRLVATSF